MSSSRGGLPGLRKDAPSRVGQTKGQLPQLATVAEREGAMKALEDDVHAASSRKAVDMKMRTISAALARWAIPLYPPTILSIKALGATLKKGGYRSAESYLLLYKGACERRGFPYTADLVRTHRDCVRSCVRGLGGATKALALPFDKFGELDLESDEPWTSGGPIGPSCALVAGAWFLMREVELSTTRAALVKLVGEKEENFAVTWSLPASKTDAQALGAMRTHGCACSSTSSAGCAYHAVKAQLSRLRRYFPSRFSEAGVVDVDLPLFPDMDGNAVSKEAMSSTIVAGAKKLGAQIETADGSARVSGHSLRMTGAQGFARWGIDTWAIQLLGRWGSNAVLDYIQEVPLELSAAWARQGGSNRLQVGAATPTSSTTSAGSSSLGLPLASRVLPRLSVEALAGMEEIKTSNADEATSGVHAKVVMSPGKVWHRVPAAGAVGPMSGWATLCGWKFSASEAVVQAKLPEPLLHKCLCKRCFPVERAAAKAAL